MTGSNPPALSDNGVWFCIRQDGRARRDGWLDRAPLAELRDRVGARRSETVEICIAEDFRPVSRRRFFRVFFPRVCGIVGLEIAFGGERTRFAPTRMLAANLSFERALEQYREKASIDVDDLFARGHVRAFAARQYLLPGGKESRPIALLRGSTVVEPDGSSDRDRAFALADGIGQWMLRNLAADGGLPYKYWPSRGTESPADNAIRRFLASLSLARLGEIRGSAAFREAARANLCFNLRKYFRKIDDNRGAIVEPAGAKLGAAALAGLAILESPARAEFLAELTLLAAGVESLADEERGFRTFFFPPERDGDNWNFYSGEALLFWAEAARRELPFAPSLEQCAAAFERCRDRHYRRRNPAFVPWHTQACASLFAQTGRRDFAAFALEINDWLLSMQQWDGVPADMRGRFYDPHRPGFGPPHAASTGAYMEGLADAAALACALGESGRASLFRRAVSRGLRSLRQLQFRSAVDAFYISKKDRAMGALRTEVYDNAIRIDSAAHALAAALKILRPMEFGAPGSPRAT